MARASPSAEAATGLRLYFLGRLRIERDTRPIRLPRRKVESLLAYLVLRPEAHAREQLAALFGGGSPDVQARHSLRTALGALRKGLGAEFLLADREAVQLNPACPAWVDAREFQTQAAQLLADPSPEPIAVDVELYRGDLQWMRSQYPPAEDSSLSHGLWTYTKDNIVLQIQGSLPETEASKYEAALNAWSTESREGRPYYRRVESQATTRFSRARIASKAAIATSIIVASGSRVVRRCKARLGTISARTSGFARWRAVKRMYS